MSAIGPVSSYATSLLGRLPGLDRAQTPAAPVRTPAPETAPGAKPPGFGSVFERLVTEVDARQDAAAAATKDVLLGKNDQLHQSVIAMQEASVAFSLMVEVRNKLVESYQELMRMPV
jgi:flagellar hook-basal body complex protein FliE